LGSALESLERMECGMNMATKTEREKLSDRFHAMKASDGLLDMKFHLGRVSEATTDQVCGRINAMLDDYADGRVHWIESWKDSNKS